MYWPRWASGQLRTGAKANGFPPALVYPFAGGPHVEGERSKVGLGRHLDLDGNRKVLLVGHVEEVLEIPDVATVDLRDIEPEFATLLRLCAVGAEYSRHKYGDTD